jgi:hypothetical protein
LPALPGQVPRLNLQCDGPGSERGAGPGQQTRFIPRPEKPLLILGYLRRIAIAVERLAKK